MNPLLYFGHADLQMRPYLTPAEFARSLISRLVFEGDLAISDAFWFMSHHLTAAAERPGLVREGLRAGAIQPWFRKPSTTFTNGLQAIRDDHIIGLLPNAESLAKDLDRDLDGSITPGRWPEQKLVGASFLDEVQNVFQAKRPPIDVPHALEIWNATGPWRTEAVKLAIHQEDGTLRRGKLLDVVGRTLGWKKKEEVPNAAVLLQLARRVGKEDLVRPYVAWVNQVYQKNQADQFQLGGALRAGRAVEQLGLYGMLSPGRLRTDIIRTVVPIPSPSTMQKEPAALLRVRASAGTQYFARLRQWQEDGREPDVVLEALDAYATALRAAFPRQPLVRLDYWLSLDDIAANRGILTASIRDRVAGSFIGQHVWGAYAFGVTDNHARWLDRARQRYTTQALSTRTATVDVTLLIESQSSRVEPRPSRDLGGK